jgi:hypothetical protein
LLPENTEAEPEDRTSTVTRPHREGADMTKWCADATPTPPLHSSLRALSCANHSPELSLRTHTSSCALQLAGAYFLVLRGLPQADEIYEGSNLKSNRALMRAKGTLWHLNYHVRVRRRLCEPGSIFLDHVCGRVVREKKSYFVIWG